MPETAHDIACYTHAGRRRANEDAVVDRRLSDGREVVAVADGMGGHAAGEVASTTALRVLVAELEAGSDLLGAMRAANATVYVEARRSADRRGMGSTLIALLRTGDSYQIANVGDSRAYRIDTSGTQQLTQDHSFVADAVRSGTMSAEAAASSPWRNALTRAVGTDPEVEVDLFGPFSTAQPHVVLLCTDGAHKALPDTVLREYVLGTEHIGSAVNSLAALAFRRGSDDNITLAGLEFGSLPRSLPVVTIPVPIARQASVSRPQATVRAQPSAEPQAATLERQPAVVAQAAPPARLPLALGFTVLLLLLTAAAFLFWVA